NVTFAPLTGKPCGSDTVPDRVAVFTCAEAVMTQPSTSKSRSAPANMNFNEADTHPPSLRCMTPPSWAPEELPLPLAVAGQPAVSKMKQLNTRLLLQYSVAFN